jgi:predicted Zn finger-like uncharacterized protein
LLDLPQHILFNLFGFSRSISSPEKATVFRVRISGKKTSSGILDVPGSRKSIEEIRACLNITCPHCGASIAPDEQVRIDFERLKCPSCRQTFTPTKARQ